MVAVRPPTSCRSEPSCPARTPPCPRNPVQSRRHGSARARSSPPLVGSRIAAVSPAGACAWRQPTGRQEAEHERRRADRAAGRRPVGQRGAAAGARAVDPSSAERRPQAHVHVADLAHRGAGPVRAVRLDLDRDTVCVFVHMGSLDVGAARHVDTEVERAPVGRQRSGRPLTDRAGRRTARRGEYQGSRADRPSSRIAHGDQHHTTNRESRRVDRPLPPSASAARTPALRSGARRPIMPADADMRRSTRWEVAMRLEGSHVYPVPVDAVIALLEDRVGHRREVRGHGSPGRRDPRARGRTTARSGSCRRGSSTSSCRASRRRRSSRRTR